MGNLGHAWVIGDGGKPPLLGLKPEGQQLCPRSWHFDRSVASMTRYLGFC